MDKLNAGLIEAVLDTKWLGRPVIYLPEVGSTNVYLQQVAGEGAPTGTLVIADYQTAGKGRLERRWEAPAGSSLLFSLLFRPGWPAGEANWLTMIAGLAVVEAMETMSGLTCGLKWPNDVMCRVQGVWHKAGGLLLAAGLAGEQVSYAVMGIGLNVNIPAGEMPPTATPATSLLIATGRVTTRLPLLVNILHRLETLYEAAGEGQSPQPAWNSRLISLGEQVTVNMGEQTLSGMMVGTGAEGQLLVRDEKGVLHEITAGDVTLRE